jgi:hypothetical protein
LALTLARIAATQTARKTAKGPRALGLVQLAPSGKAHLIPIAILIDGKFYDASAYKADPVPFALDSEVVYEAVQTGISKGLFTVSGALHNQNNWIGEGTWQAAGSAPKKKKITDEKPKLEDDSGPPVLRKSGSPKSNPTPEPAPSAPSQPQPSATPAPAPAPPAATPAAPAPAGGGDEQQSDEDPNRPVLRRGTQPARNQSAAAQSAPSASHSAVSPPPQGKNAKPGAIQLIPAVSDAHGPEPRPYIFEMKPDEEQQYRKKMLALAAVEVQKKAREMTPVMPGAAPAKRTPAPTRPAKAPSPTFDDIELRAFDLWNTNQPVFVISASAHLPASAASAVKEPHTYFVTLVADADIYTELHKLLVEVTDQQHLDEFPRLEVIDAVDADGDGRGELLFRQVSDAGTAWVIYRATADTLYPLFEGTPTKIATIAP